MNTFSKAELFKAYNSAKNSIKKLHGKSLDGKFLDVGRLNRAFGILQTKNYDFKRYRTTLGKCLCPDAKNGFVCKHRIALTVAYKIEKGRSK